MKLAKHEQSINELFIYVWEMTLKFLLHWNNGFYNLQIITSHRFLSEKDGMVLVTYVSRTRTRYVYN